jgi:hypothetical protein
LAGSDSFGCPCPGEACWWVPLFGKFGGPPGVSAALPPFHWVLFPPRPRPFSSVFGCPQFFPGMSWREQQSSWVFEADESSNGVGPEEGVVYPRAMEVAKSCFSTMGISFRGSEEGFLDFLTLIDEGQEFVSASKKKGKREVKNLECSINFNARGGGSSRVRGKKLGV